VLANDDLANCIDNKEAANKLLHRIKNEWPLRNNDNVTEYIQDLGVRLAHLTEHGLFINWKFSVVRDLEPNAFSIGNGYVFVTEGVINFAQNEDEIASVLAHEIGHELAGDFCKTTDNFFKTLSDLVFTSENSQHQKIKVGSLTQVVDPIKEQRADRIALSILEAAGYEPKAMLELAYRLSSNGVVHFSDASRIQALEKEVDFLPLNQLRKTSDKFLAVKKILATQ
jgi:predicted Zn-dependent protease